MGRSAADINHYVKGLADGGFLSHCPDAFRANRSEHAQPVLLLFSGSGFTGELTAQAAHSDGTIQLIGLDRL